MKALVKALETKRDGDVVNRALAGSPSAGTGFAQVGAAGDWDIEKAVQAGLEKVIWVFRCVDAIASNQASTPMVIREGDPDEGSLVDDSDLLSLLNRYPNSYESAWQFRYRLSTMALLSRKGVFIEVVPTNGGGIAELHLIPPHKIAPIPDEKKFVSGFTVYGADYKEYTVKPDRIVWLRPKPHPLDPYLCLTPMVASGIAADIDYYSRLFNRNFIVNDGRPGLLVALQGRLNPKDAEEVKRRFSGGPATAGQTTVIEAEGLAVQDMAANPRDVQWLEGIRGSKEDILLAFGVPESVMGNASGRTWDNADAERENFWVDTMFNHNGSIENALDILTGARDDTTYLKYLYDGIDVLQRQKRARHDKMLEEFKSGVLTIDEYLEGTGREPKNLPGTRVYFHPSGVLIGTPEDVAATTGGGEQEPAPIVPSPEESARRGAIEGSRVARRELENVLSARKEMKVAITRLDRSPYEDVRYKMEGAIEGALTSLTERQVEILGSRLNHIQARKGTRHWDGSATGTKALDTAYILDLQRWADEAQRTIGSIVEPYVREEASKAARELQRAGVIDQRILDGEGNASGTNPLEQLIGSKGDVDSVLSQIVFPILDIVDRSVKNQTQRVGHAIAEADDDGADIDTIRVDIGKRLRRGSAWHKALGTWVTTAAVEGIRNLVMTYGGDYVTKTWRTVGDEKVRDSHWKVDGTEKKADGAFRVGGFPMMFPGDPSAPPGETANCRCWLQFQIRTP